MPAFWRALAFEAMHLSPVFWCFQQALRGCHLIASIPAAAVLADKGYDAQERVVEPLLRQGKQVVIPSRRYCKEKRPYDKHLYKAPHLIENFFARLKQYRCIATRYDKTADAFLGGIYLAAIAIWLN